MQTEDRLYEPPVLAGIGDFVEVTLGAPGFNFDIDWLCFPPSGGCNGG